MGCALFVDFPPKPDASGGAGGASTTTGGGGLSAQGGGGNGTGGGGGSAPCPPVGAVAATLVGGEAKLLAVTSDATTIFAAATFDGDQLMRVAAQPDNACQQLIAGQGGRPTVLLAFERDSWELRWWAWLATDGGATPSADLVTRDGELAVASTYADGATFLGGARPVGGFGWGAVARAPLTIDAVTREAELDASLVHDCTGTGQSVALSTRGTGLALAATASVDQCTAGCPVTAPTDPPDGVFFELDGALACAATPLAFFVDNKLEVDVDVATVGGVETLLGWRTDVEAKGRYMAVNAALETDFGALGTTAPLGRVYVAGTSNYGLVVTTKISGGHRLVLRRAWDAGRSAFDPPMPIPTADMVDVIADNATALTSERMLIVGSIDESKRVGDAFLGSLDPDVAQDTCAIADPAATCGDAYFAVLDAGTLSVIGGQRWTAPGHQALTCAEQATDGALVLGGAFDKGLAVVSGLVDVGAFSGAFLTVAPPP